MNKTKLWMMAAILTICGMTMVSCFSDTKKSAAVSATDDVSQFVTITDVVPRAVRMAVAIDAISCTINFAVSFLDIILNF